MKPEDVVCTFEQSKKLITLGLRLSAIYYYNPVGKLVNPKDYCGITPNPIQEYELIPAYLVSEMMFILHKYSNWEFIDFDDRQAEYLGEILIEEISNKYINPKRIKL